MKISELPYNRDSSMLFSAVADEPWSMFLDSGYPYIDTGRYDIIVSRPTITLETRGGLTDIHENNSHKTVKADPFALVKKYLADKDKNFSGLPFCGGASGYFAYDLGRRIEALDSSAIDDLDMPEMAIGIYDWSVVVDHHVRRSWLVSYDRFKETESCWGDLQKLFLDIKAYTPSEITIKNDVESNISRTAYNAAFQRIKKYILEGDCYQVNLAQRFAVEVEGSSWDAYLKLRRLNPAPYAAYINLPSGAVLSSSPERFLRVMDNRVETKPIKGTKHRSAFAYEDKALAVSLLESEKDRAENLMIVDLLRNDISKSCKPGSVLVPKLFALETYATVHHLVSTITGQLDDDKHALDLLRGCFPGGSITGAPKLRAMEIIEELEPHRRSVYCGSIAYIGFDGNMDSNICIRTLLSNQNKLYFHVGGGIVWDSQVDAEYKECFDKAAAMLKLVQKNIEV